MARLVDTHAHLTDPQFESDLDQVLERAREVGVSAVITVGCVVSLAAVSPLTKPEYLTVSVGRTAPYAFV